MTHCSTNFRAMIQISALIKWKVEMYVPLSDFELASLILNLLADDLHVFLYAVIYMLSCRKYMSSLNTL